MHHWTPPKGGYGGALNHVVIHALDITLPLGTPREPPAETMKTLLTDLTEGGTHAFFEVAIADRRLQATDLDWSYGTGEELRGTAAALTLALTGRKLSAGHLTGPPL